MRTRESAVIVLSALALFGCSTGPQPLPPQPPAKQSPNQKSEIKVTSAAFKEGQPIRANTLATG